MSSEEGANNSDNPEVSRSLQKAPEGSRRFQKAPKGLKKIQRSPGGWGCQSGGHGCLGGLGDWGDQ